MIEVIHIICSRASISNTATGTGNNYRYLVTVVRYHSRLVVQLQQGTGTSAGTPGTSKLRSFGLK